MAINKWYHLFSQNTQLHLRSMNIRLNWRRRSMTEQSPWFCSLWVALMNPFFFTSNDAMRKTLPFLLLEQLFTEKKKRRSTSLDFKNKELKFYDAQRMQSLGNGLVVLLLILKQAIFVFGMNYHRRMPPIQHLRRKATLTTNDDYLAHISDIFTQKYMRQKQIN